MARTKFNVDKDKDKRTFAGIVFDSQLEMKYFRDVLCPRVESGDVVHFELQKKYELQPKFTHDGKTVLPITYVADFYIEYADGHTEVIDTKGCPDSVAKIKRKMFWHNYPDVRYRWITYVKNGAAGWTMRPYRLCAKNKSAIRTKRRTQTMADKEKKISIASFDKVLKEQAVPNTTEHWFGNEVVIKHTISIAQMLAFVDNVVSSCFHDEGYMPEVKDLLIKSNLLTRYANFTLPENLEHRYTLIYNTDAVAIVSKHISSAQFDEILRAIDEKIDYICNTNIMAIEKQMQQLAASFEDVSKKTSEMFAGVNGSDVAKLIGAIDKGGVDEQKLVQAFLEQREDYKE